MNNNELFTIIIFSVVNETKTNLNYTQSFWCVLFIYIYKGTYMATQSVQFQ